MAWQNKQKFLVHLYRSAAALDDQDYRELLHHVSGCRSAAHPALTQFHFDRFMAQLEGILWQRVQEGVVPAPDSRKIKDLWYWRHKLPATGRINSRQIHEIHDWWYKLSIYLPAEQRTPEYLHAIAKHATGRAIKSLSELSAHGAGLVIEAVKDRLRWALKTRSPEEAVAEAGAPALAGSPDPSARGPMDPSSGAAGASPAAPESVSIGHSQGVRGAENAPPGSLLPALAEDTDDDAASIVQDVPDAALQPALVAISASAAPVDRVTAGGNVGAEELPF